jgi:hypothetical protein
MPAILTQYASRDAVIIFISAELHLQSVRRTTLHLFLVNLNKKGECVAVAGPGVRPAPSTARKFAAAGRKRGSENIKKGLQTEIYNPLT